ncbi:SRPBCC domain-containing protein [Microbacterium sp. G2-8]|uniref:SRPBCC domain-containing protein n=1 Tax=Microbacterium sp. G2-8 TaxID=2842454 RepID=UPI001C894028|nr:SRPBCC domain-containing protein [Microbacterium sp. G2-8]
MERIDRAERIIAASAASVYTALVDPTALGAWLPPDEMTAAIDRFAPGVGGGFRMTLSYPDSDLEPDGSGPGKTTPLTDVVDVSYTRLEPDALVEWQARFVTPAEASAPMTQTWSLIPVTHAGTRVEIAASDVPRGVPAGVHEAALATSLDQLAAWVIESVR